MNGVGILFSRAILLPQLECQRVREVSALLGKVSGLADKLAASQLYVQSLEQELGMSRPQKQGRVLTDHQFGPNEPDGSRAFLTRLQVRSCWMCS